MSERDDLIKQQRKEALEELQRHGRTLFRLKRLIRDQNTYEPEALGMSLEAILNELSYTCRRMLARCNMIVVIRQGRLDGLPPE